MSTPAVPNGLTQLIATFGDLRPYIQDDGHLSPKWDTDTMTRFDLPFPIPLGAATTQMVTKMHCHKLLVDVFLATFTDLKNAGLQSKIQTYDGCYADRAKRGDSHWSCHAWGIAVDLNASANPLGGASTMDPAVIQVFRNRGFLWGGDFQSRKDPMHFQYCTGY